MLKSLSDFMRRLDVARRAFVLGPGAFDRFAASWGVQGEQDPELGEYIQSSGAVYSVVTQRARMLASLPLNLYRGDKLVESGSLRDLLNMVNPFWTFSRLIEMTELSLCLYGEAFWFLERGQRGGEPREIWWGRSDRVRVIPHAEDYIKGFLYQPINSAQVIPFKPEEVIWFRYTNPLNEFDGLSPLRPIRKSVDMGVNAVSSNNMIFSSGLQMSGYVTPKEGSEWSKEQAEELADLLQHRFTGRDAAHRFAVFRHEVQMGTVGIKPKDAEFLGALNYTLEEVARVYHWPIDLVGGQRTYENYNAALKAAWTHALVPEAKFLADDLTERLLPMFKGQADRAEFDKSGIAVLQEEETSEWARAKEQITIGAKTINEWRVDKGLDPLPWGDAWWAGAGMAPITSAEIVMPELPAPDLVAPDAPQTASIARSHARVAVEFGSREHAALWVAFERSVTAQEKAWRALVADLLKRQDRSIKDKLRSEKLRALDDVFDMKRWIKEFREAARPVVRKTADDGGKTALTDLDLQIDFNVDSPAMRRFLAQRAQRFAREVNETTWAKLKASLQAAIDAGESQEQIEARVDAVMAGRINSDAETIARTEVVGALNGGTVEAWRQSGVVKGKRWLAELDDRTRETHQVAHGQTVGLDEDFEVGAGRGPAPGQIGLAEEDINCRCTVTAVLDV